MKFHQTLRMKENNESNNATIQKATSEKVSCQSMTIAKSLQDFIPRTIKNGFDNVFFDDLFTDVGAVYDKGLEAFVISINSEETFNAFLHHVVTVIKTREEKIKKWMSDNNIVVEDSWDYPVDD